MTSVNSSTSSKGKIISPVEVFSSIETLSRSAAGAAALQSVNELLDQGGADLPADEQRAILSLLVASWTGTYHPASAVPT